MVDNCLFDPSINNQDLTELMHLLLNTTFIEKDHPFPECSLLDFVCMLLWSDYSLIAFTDYNCFGKTKTSKERQPALLAYADNVLKNFKKKLDKLDANYPKFYKERTS